MNTQNLQSILSKEVKIPVLDRLYSFVDKFSITERLIFFFFVTICLITSAGLAAKVNNAFLVEIPARGGSVSEGVIGLPRFINPLLAISDADRDLTTLVYSGLLKATPDGSLINDLSEYYSISPDGKVYTFVLKENIYFHDGTKVTTEDVKFTIERAQDPLLKSSRRASWDGVEIRVVNEKEIIFILKQAYVPFLENLTLGILPKHIWKDASAEQFPFSSLNVEPIGSGPYMVSTIKRNSSGLPIRYQLKAFKKYALGEAYIKEILIKFYSNETELLNAYKKREVEGINGVSPVVALGLEKEGVEIKHATLPRVFAVFFNQNQQILFTNKEIREALNIGLDKNRIVREVLKGYGSAISSPILPEYVAGKATIETAPDYVETAQKILENNGWKLASSSGFMEKKGNILQFSLSTSNVPELKQAAEIIKEEWGKIGVNVDIKIFEPGDLNQDIIRGRKYDALLFGEVVGRDLDLFPFWHSSQRNDPGLNIAMYTNITVDKILEEARTTLDPALRRDKYQKFEKEIQKDIPAVFTYSPDFIYVTSNRVRNINLGKMTTPSERFLDVSNWYVETEKVWEFFVREKTL
ncbi:MAG: ABC transporter substrate-binding protein [Patescibacteria group bacterium]